MNNIKKNFYGVSLAALAFSLNPLSESHAQTCTVPPDCATLGFTKVAADCDGKTILKCPFDQTKVYCPGYVESSKTYDIGDVYTVNGVAVGKVISVTDCGAGGDGGSNVIYSNPQGCLGLAPESHDYVTGNDSFGNRIFTSSKSSITCMFGRVYNDSGGSTYGIFRINGGSGGGCMHGTVSNPVIRTGTRKEAMDTCAKMSTGSMSWYLPSTYTGYYFGYGSSASTQPYMSGLWAVANGCFYSGSFYGVSDSLYQNNCQTSTGSYPNEVFTDKEMSYYCISMF